MNSKLAQLGFFLTLIENKQNYHYFISLNVFDFYNKKNTNDPDLSTLNAAEDTIPLLWFNYFLFNLKFGQENLKFNIIGIKINEMVGGASINTDHKEKKLKQLCQFFNADLISLPDSSIDYQSEIESKIGAINDKKHIDSTLNHPPEKSEKFIQ